MLDWDQVFGLSAPIVETIGRATAMYLVLFALMRVTGTREAGAYSPTDLIVVVLVAEAAAPGLIGESETVLDSLLLIVTILFWSVVLDALAYRSPRLARILKRNASALIEDGKINKRALRREFMEEEELMGQLRLQGIADLSSVWRAYLEPNGAVSVLRKSRKGSGKSTKPSG